MSIPCEGSYCRALVALSFALSPLWLGVYVMSNFDINIWGWKMGVFFALNFFIGIMIMRYAPGGDGTMAPMLAVSSSACDSVHLLMAAPFSQRLRSSLS